MTKHPAIALPVFMKSRLFTVVVPSSAERPRSRAILELHSSGKIVAVEPIVRSLP